MQFTAVLTIQTNNYATKMIILQKIDTMIQKNYYNIQIQKELNEHNLLFILVSNWMQKSLKSVLYYVSRENARE